MNTPSPDESFSQLARQRQDQLIKPTGALGRLEDIACWFASCQRQVIAEKLRPAVTVFAADHGVAAQQVSAYPAAVTQAMLASLANGQAAIAVLARNIDALYQVVDVGVNRTSATPQNVFDERVANGTCDLSKQAAMTLNQLEQALSIGAKYADRAIDLGSTLLIAGEVGIGNTTAAACIIAALTKLDPAMIVGSGTGLDTKGREHKQNIVRQAMQRISGLAAAPFQIMGEVGGFEIAAITGYYLQAARRGIPILLDGYISTAAALVASQLQPTARDWMIASHQSAELGHALALEHLQLKPLLSLGMRLGEGTGAAIAVPVIQAALRLHKEMATFAEAGVPNA